MNKLILLSIFISLALTNFSQEIDSVYQNSFFYGAWVDSTVFQNGAGMAFVPGGFVFNPDGCCQFIIDGNIMDCIIEQKNMKVHYKVDYDSVPNQLDINILDLKTDTIKDVIPMIFEIIDPNHMRIVRNKYDRHKRPTDFNSNNSSEITLFSRYVGDIKELKTR